MTNDRISAFNSNFFKSLSENATAEQTAKDYIGLFLSQHEIFESYKEKSNTNISLVSDNNSFEFLTRRLPIISDTGILSHHCDNFLHINQSSSKRSLHDTSRSYFDVNYEINDATYLDCPSLEVLGKWLLDCKDLLTMGNLAYLPRIKTESWKKPVGKPVHNESIEILRRGSQQKIYQPVADAIVAQRKLVDIKTQNHIHSKYIKHIVSLEIPVIENASLADFSRITADEKSQFDLFRNFIQQKLMEIDDTKNSEFHMQQFEKLKLELEKGVIQIKSDINRIKTKRAFSVTGAVIASLLATLVVVDSGTFEDWQRILGSGGLLLFWRAMEDNKSEKGKLLQNQSYYLWLLDRRSTT